MQYTKSHTYVILKGNRGRHLHWFIYIKPKTKKVTFYLAVKPAKGHLDTTCIHMLHLLQTMHFIKMQIINTACT